MIYIASPYTGTAEEMEYRYKLAVEYVAHLCNWYPDIVPYSPIVHFHSVAVAHDLPRHSGYWKRINTHMLRRADGLHILMMDGWEESDGVHFERGLAYDESLSLSEGFDLVLQLARQEPFGYIAKPLVQFSLW